MSLEWHPSDYIMLLSQALIWIGLIPTLAGIVPVPYQVGTTNGDSMEPNLNGCEVLMVDETVSFEDVEAGDIIKFQWDGEAVIHRYQGNGLALGDNNRDNNKGIMNYEKVDENNYIGKVSTITNITC